MLHRSKGCIQYGLIVATISRYWVKAEKDRVTLKSINTKHLGKKIPVGNKHLSDCKTNFFQTQIVVLDEGFCVNSIFRLIWVIRQG